MKTLFFIMMTLCLGGIVHTQQTVTGKVTDKTTNEPLGMATVLVKGSSPIISALVDQDGYYSIQFLDSNAVLEFRFIGYETRKIKVGDKSVINVKMEYASSELDAIVKVGYGEIKRHDATGSITVIDREELTRIPAASFDRALQGYAPGTMINATSGAPGSGPSIKVRGVGSINPGIGYYDPGMESYKKQAENSFKNAKSDPLSTFSIDVDRASYSNIRRFIEMGQKPPVDAVRVEEMINYFDYGYANPDDNHPIAIYTEMAACPWNSKHRLLHIGLKGKDIAVENVPVTNLVFLIDVSGSMADVNKLPLLKKAFRMLTNNLRENDVVSIVTYAGNAGLVLPATKGNRKQQILDAIDNLEAGGSTAGCAGIQLAYKIARENFIQEGNNRVILATDGDFNVGISNENELEKFIEQQRDQKIFLTCIGVGMGNYKDSKIEILADKGNGNYAYFDNLPEAQKIFGKEFSGTLYTIAKDVKAQIEFNPQHVKKYRLIGYENRLLKNEDFKNDKKDAGEMGAGHTVTILYEIIPAGTSDEDTDVDSLKYQKVADNNIQVYSEETATLKIRYKRPEETKSIELIRVISDTNTASVTTSDIFRFSASVALMGMILSESDYCRNAGYKDVIGLAENARGKDEEGYKAEFIRLVKSLSGI